MDEVAGDLGLVRYGFVSHVRRWGAVCSLGVPCGDF
jgi:hypothetical protein